MAVVTELTMRGMAGPEPRILVTAVKYRNTHSHNLADTIAGMRSLPPEYTAALRLECDKKNIWPQLLLIKPDEEKPRLDHRLRHKLAKTFKRATKGRGTLRISKAPYSAPWINQGGYEAVWGAGALWSAAHASIPKGAHTSVFEKFQHASARLCRIDTCDGCWGSILRLNKEARYMAKRSKTSLNKAREKSEFFLEIDCGAQPGDKFTRCSAELEKAQRELDAANAPDVTWHYGNIGNTYSADWRAYIWGDNYARLQRIKNELDPHQQLMFRQSVGGQQV